jgi:hypothetical protein
LGYKSQIEDFEDLQYHVLKQIKISGKSGKSGKSGISGNFNDHFEISGIPEISGTITSMFYRW